MAAWISNFMDQNPHSYSEERVPLLGRTFISFCGTNLRLFNWVVGYLFSRMLVLTWTRCCAVMFLVAALKMGTSQVSETRPKANSIKPVGLEETPTPATNRSTTVHSRVTKKHNILAQVTYISYYSYSIIIFNVILKICMDFTHSLKLTNSKWLKKLRNSKVALTEWIKPKGRISFLFNLNWIMWVQLLRALRTFMCERLFSLSGFGLLVNLNWLPDLTPQLGAVHFHCKLLKREMWEKVNTWGNFLSGSLCH